ncbi:MAG: serine protease [Alphaproteobacteria bacterium]|nr:serine protease [Alphaproteobacteria bacterium]
MLLQDRYLTRTLRIRYAHGPGSAIMICVRGRGYLVTARHVVEGIQAGENIEFRVDDVWMPIPIRQAKLSELDDIAILISDNVNEQGLDEALISGLLTVGQPVAYCGFPLGLEGVAPAGHRWPIPLVKAATYSGSILQNGRMVHLFDTLNNKGFSGGPIFAQDPAGMVKLAAIVSGYHFDRHLDVMRRAEGGVFEPVPDFAVQPNSGFMKAVPIPRALELVAEIENGE